MISLRTTIGIVFLAWLCHRIQFMYFILDLHKSSSDIAPTKNFAKCHHDGVALPITAFEDVVMVDAETGISCGGDIHALWHKSNFSSRGSLCVLIRLVGQGADGKPATVSIDPLTITSFDMYHEPNNINGATKLHLHGLSVVSDDLMPEIKYLYGINHAYDKGDERIEVFSIDSAHLQLHHIFSLVIDKATLESHRGALNDLIIVGLKSKPDGMLMSGVIFVTTYLEFADPITGRVGQPMLTVMRKISQYGRALLNNFGTKLLRCYFDTTKIFVGKHAFNKDVHLKCDSYMDGFAMANGIIHAPLLGSKATAVFVVDTMLH